MLNRAWDLQGKQNEMRMFFKDFIDHLTFLRYSWDEEMRGREELKWYQAIDNFVEKILEEDLRKYFKNFLHFQASISWSFYL